MHLPGDPDALYRQTADGVVPQQVRDQRETPLANARRALLGRGIFGGKDVQVIAESNEAALREALAAGGNEDVTTMTFPDANHLFQEADTGAFGEYAQLEPEFVDGFVDTVVDWIVVRAGVIE